MLWPPLPAARPRTESCQNAHFLSEYFQFVLENGCTGTILFERCYDCTYTLHCVVQYKPFQNSFAAAGHLVHLCHHNEQERPSKRNISKKASDRRTSDTLEYFSQWVKLCKRYWESTQIKVQKLVDRVYGFFIFSHLTMKKYCENPLNVIISVSVSVHTVDWREILENRCNSIISLVGTLCKMTGLYPKFLEISFKWGILSTQAYLFSDLVAHRWI